MYQNHVGKYLVLGNAPEQYLIPNNPDGDHFSFHKSGEIHFKDMKNQNTIPIGISDFTDPIENSFNDIIEFLELIEKERRNPEFREAMKYVAMFIRCYQFNCKNENCPNSRGISFNYDLFIETIILISNERKENIIAEPEEDEDEFEEETTFQKLFSDYIPDLAEFQCQSCKNRPFIHKSHSKFKMRKCHLCHGYGIDFEKIEKYKID
jgi:hypothetical protein